MIHIIDHTWVAISKINYIAKPTPTQDATREHQDKPYLLFVQCDCDTEEPAQFSFKTLKERDDKFTELINAVQEYQPAGTIINNF